MKQVLNYNSRYEHGLDKLFIAIVSIVNKFVMMYIYMNKIILFTVRMLYNMFKEKYCFRQPDMLELSRRSSI